MAGIDSDAPAGKLVKITKANNALAGGTCRGLLVGTEGTANLVDASGNACADVPLQQGYNPVAVRQGQPWRYSRQHMGALLMGMSLGLSLGLTSSTRATGVGVFTFATRASHTPSGLSCLLLSLAITFAQMTPAPEHNDRGF